MVGQFEFQYLGKAATATGISSPQQTSIPPDAAKAIPDDNDETAGRHIDISFGIVCKPASGQLWLGMRKLPGW